MKRGFWLAVIGLVLLTQYTNCSKYSEGLNYDDGLTDIGGGGTVTSYEGVRVANGDTYMNCDEDHVQLGGTCNTADAVDNCIEYRILRDRTAVYWGSGSTTVDALGCNPNHIRVKCENGRFFAVVPKPNDTGLSAAGTDFLEYQVHFQIYTSTDGLQYKAGEKAPAFIINVQKNGACGG